MSFLLRATLVIGALSYLAVLRAGGDPPAARLPPGIDAALGTDVATGLAGSWTAMPADLRAQIAREGMAELTRRLAAMPASRDTLAEADRVPAWRGGGTGRGADPR